LKNKEKKKQHIVGCCCSICGKKLKFARTSKYALTCWQCMIVNMDIILNKLHNLQAPFLNLEKNKLFEK
jgi:hypothetical protein